jgi:hypothetical protein
VTERLTFECADCGNIQTMLPDHERGVYVMMPCPCRGIEEYLRGPLLECWLVPQGEPTTQLTEDEYGNYFSPPFHLDDITDEQGRVRLPAFCLPKEL